MNNKSLGFAGAALLLAGLFLPVASVPIVGTVTLMSAGLNWAAFSLLGLALLSAFLLARERSDDLIWTGGAALLLLLYMIARLQYGFSTMRAELAASLKDNPFAERAETALASAGLQWGWIVLLLGAGLLVHVAYQARNENGAGLFVLTDPGERLVLILSVLALLAVPTRDAWSYFDQSDGSNDESPGAAADPSTVLGAADGEASGQALRPSAAEAAYMRDNVKIYDLTAKYYETYEGREPGVDFKIKNLGNRTLDTVKVTVVFYDAEGKAISEDEYYPVNVGGYSMSGNDGPLRPNYIWTQEQGQFYSAKSVPDEWDVGKVSAKVTEIKFGPNA